LAKAYAAIGNFENAYKYSVQFKNQSDSIANEENTKKIVGLEYTYKYEKEKELAEIEKQKQTALQQEELKRQKSIRNSFIIGFILVLLLFTFAFYSFVQKRKSNLLLTAKNNVIEEKNKELLLQKMEIEAQNKHLENANSEITNQKEIIEKSHQHITDSINYAKRIQTAVLPNPEMVFKLLPENFIFFKPRDIVSGDFYFIKQIDNIILIAAADCTGHGVPGAFMSMLGIALLNEIVRNSEIKNSSQILNELRSQIKRSLQQTGQIGEQQEGMDIAFCSINLENMNLSFAGAYNSCWIFRNEKPKTKSEKLDEDLLTSNYSLYTLKADRMPVGIYIFEKSFSEHTFQLQKNDIIYIFSDGYISQFGGENNEKFKTIRLKKILSNIYTLPMVEQQNKLEQEYHNWKGNKEQVDDILIIGIKI